MINETTETNYRWYILALATLTSTLTVAAPTMSLSVLFPELAEELGLSLVQIGLIWGLGSIPAIITGILAGPIGDRYGARRTILVSCVLVGISGASRGLANNFPTLLAAVFLFGLLSPLIPMNVIKTNRLWFSYRQLGLANGVTSMGMALGFMFGSLFSASVLSPWLDGWRNVLFFYGVISIIICVPWLFTRTAPADQVKGPAMIGVSFWSNMSVVVRVNNVVILGMAILGTAGCIQGLLGYLPLYLREIGWQESLADGAQAAFHTASLIFVIPIAVISDRLGVRKPVLLITTMLIMIGTGLLSIAQGSWIWVAMCLAGMARDGFMAVFMTAITEVKGIGISLASTTIGITMVFIGFGNLIAPPLGNSLAQITPSAPFLFWTFMAGFGFVTLLLFHETSKNAKLQTAAIEA